MVTASRRPTASLVTPLSLSAVGNDAIRLLGATHHAEVLNRLPGVMIQRGSGQESLTAIRSPVLTGAGSCGAFLFLENGVPIRPVGFCNVNELFEVNTEQAARSRCCAARARRCTARTPCTASVNVLQPRPRRARCAPCRPRAPAPPTTAASKLAGRFDSARHGLWRSPQHVTHDGGWRDDAGFDEAKLNATAASRLARRHARIDFAATALEQDTAGFITGKDAYRDEQASRANPNPEAYREAHALRLIRRSSSDPGRSAPGSSCGRTCAARAWSSCSTSCSASRSSATARRACGLMSTLRVGRARGPPARRGARPRAGGLLPAAGTGRPHAPTARRRPTRSVRPASTTTTTCAPTSPRCTCTASDASASG